MDGPSASAVQAEPRGVSPGQLQRLASRGWLWTIVHTAVSIPLGFAANAVVSRSLGPEEYGSLAILMLVMNMVIAVSNLGVGAGTSQWGAGAHARGDDERVDDLLKASLGYRLFVQLPVLLVAALMIGDGQGPGVRCALIVGAVVPCVLGSAALCVVIENKTAGASRQAMIINVLVQLGVAGTALAVPGHVAVWAARYSISAVMHVANFRLLTRRRRRVCLRWRLPTRMPGGFWRYCVPVAAASSVGLIINSRSEALVLQYLGSAKDVGIYALAFGIATQLRGPVDAILVPLQPSISGIYSAHRHLAGRTLARCLRVSGLFGGGLLLFTPLLTAAVPAIYGPAFASAGRLLPVLASATLVQCLTNPLIAFAHAQRKASSLLVVNVIAVVTDLAVAIGGVVLWGIWGAVLGTAAAQAVAVLLRARIQVRMGLLDWRTMALTATPLYAAAVVNGLVACASVPWGGWAYVVVWPVGVVAWVLVLRSLHGPEAAADLHDVTGYLPRALVRPGKILLGILAPVGA